MGTNGFTPEEWRTAARIARRSIFTEGNPDLADAWEKAADQAEARLIPAGGMALTAEEFADFLNVIWEGRGDYSSRDRLREKFPTSEHDEARLQRKSALAPTDGDTQIPTPAEPAEEETKARCPSEIEGWGCSLTNGHDGDHTAYDQDGPAYVWPTSSPVAPAATEASVIGGAAVALRAALALVDPHEAGLWEHAWLTAKDLEDCAGRAEAIAPSETEWPTWQEVPEGVWFYSRQNIACWMRREGDKVTTVTGGWPVCPDSLVAQAPFVAAEER